MLWDCSHLVFGKQQQSKAPVDGLCQCLMEARKVVQRCLYFHANLIRNWCLVLVDVCFHAPGNLGIGGATHSLWVHRALSCSLVQAGLGRDGKGRAGWWTREANNSLRSACFGISCQELKSCKALCLQHQHLSGYAERYIVFFKKKKSWWGKKKTL